MTPDPAALVPLSLARMAVADCILRNRAAEDSRLGSITLHPHQRSAAERVREILSRHGGALLCDEVGLGKTYVALAVAALADSVLVIAPSVLVGMWRNALVVTGVKADVVSLESLGRSGIPAARHSLIVVDEAHHFRNSCTRRYAALAHACAHARIVLLTATPLHNSRGDVSALVALFSGRRAYAMTDADFAEVIVRRRQDDGLMSHAIPRVHRAPARVVMSDSDILDKILSLPPAVPPSGGALATTLVAHGLARQWVSSNAALYGALRRRIARSGSLLASLDSGRYPTAVELAAWVYTGDAVQLAFTDLLDPNVTPVAELAETLRVHLTALDDLANSVMRLHDEPLVRFMREICAVHRGERIVAFTSYAETAEALYRGLRQQGHVALLTGRAAMIATGQVARADVLRQFSADGEAGMMVPDHQRVDVLVATDVLSEGVDLHAASVIVHLDLPWTDARLRQREGRLARLGSRHARVTAYTVNPAPRADTVLRELEILATKSGSHASLLGTVQDGQATHGETSPVSNAERVLAILQEWERARVAPPRALPSPCMAHARCAVQYAIGAWQVDGRIMLLGWFAGESGSDFVTDDHREIAAALIALQHARDLFPCIPEADLLGRIAARTLEWHEHHCASRAIGVGAGGFGRPARVSTRTLARMADSASASGFARRSGSSVLAGRLRRAAGLPLPVAVEWSLESLSESADDASVNAILEVVERAQAAYAPEVQVGIRCLGLIVASPEAP